MRLKGLFCILKENCLFLLPIWRYSLFVHSWLTIHYKDERNRNGKLFANYKLFYYFVLNKADSVSGAKVRYWERCSMLISLCAPWHQFCCVLTEVKWYKPFVKECFWGSSFFKKNICRCTMINILFSFESVCSENIHLLFLFLFGKPGMYYIL